VLSVEANNTYFIVFGLIRSGLEPKICHTRDEHANHYTADAVHNKYEKRRNTVRNDKYISERGEP
jgi:hypothetical protein